MGSKTNYLEDALLNHVLRNTAYSSPATVYVALYTVTPGETGGGTEVTGGSYARQAIVFGAPSGGVCSNQAVTFPTATVGWGTIVAFAILDNSVGGNMLYFGDITPNKAVNSGDTAKFDAGQLTVSED